MVGERVGSFGYPLCFAGDRSLFQVHRHCAAKLGAASRARADHWALTSSEVVRETSARALRQAFASSCSTPVTYRASAPGRLARLRERPAPIVELARASSGSSSRKKRELRGRIVARDQLEPGRGSRPLLFARPIDLVDFPVPRSLLSAIVLRARVEPPRLTPNQLRP